MEQHLEESSKERWAKIAEFVHASFDLSKPLAEWYDPNSFVTYYTLVYDFCTAKRTGTGLDANHQQFEYGDQLYVLLSALLETEIQGWQQAISSSTFVEDYIRVFSRFRQILPNIEAVFSYLERFWIERQKEDEGVAGIYYIRQLMVRQFVAILVVPLTPRIKEALEAVWTVEAPSESLRSLVESIKFLSVPVVVAHRAKIRFPTGITLFEDDLLPWYCDRLASIYGDKTAACPVVSLFEVDQLAEWWATEVQRAQYYLGEEALPFVKDVLKTRMLQPACERLFELFEGFLLAETDPIPSLRKIFRVLAVRRSLIAPLVPYFERGLCRRAQLKYPDLGFDHLRDHFIESNRILKEALGHNPELKTARNAAFRSLLRASDSTAARQMSLEFARWMHQALCRSDAVTVDAAVALLSFLPDKWAFQTAYQRHLASRLLGDMWDRELETRTLATIRVSLGTNYSQPLDKMIADISVQHHLDVSTQRKDKRTKVDLPPCSISILTQGIWPVEPSKAPPQWPTGFGSITQTFEAQYKRAHPKRQLHWHPGLSSVDLSLELGSSSLALRVNILQYILLTSMAFALQDIATLSVKTGLEPTLVLDLVNPFLTAGLVIADPSFRSFALNPAFTSSDPVDFSRPDEDRPASILAVSEPVRGTDQVQSVRGAPQIQASIMKYLKAATSADLPAVIQAVQHALERWFLPEQADIEAAMESLLGRDFVRLDPDTHRYHYVP